MVLPRHFDDNNLPRPAGPTKRAEFLPPRFISTRTSQDEPSLITFKFIPAQQGRTHPIRLDQGANKRATGHSPLYDLLEIGIVAISGSLQMIYQFLVRPTAILLD